VHLLTYLLTYLHSWLREYKTGNIAEAVEDRAKATINGLYKVHIHIHIFVYKTLTQRNTRGKQKLVVHGLSIAAKMYDLE